MVFFFYICSHFSLEGEEIMCFQIILRLFICRFERCNALCIKIFMAFMMVGWVSKLFYNGYV